MKKLILIIFLIISFQAFSQEICEIFSSDTIVCYGDSAYLSVVYSDTLKYLWKPTMDTTYNTWVKPTDTTKYFIEISDTTNQLICTDSILIYLYPRLYIDTLIQMNMGCPGFCKAQMKAFVSGGLPDYHYNWYALIVDPSDSSIALGLCDENYALTVKDDWGCKVDTNFDVKAYPIPEVEIIADDKVYIPNPEVEFSFNNISYEENPVDSLEIITWTWDFGDSTYSELANPVHVYRVDSTNIFLVWLSFNTYFGCVDSVSHALTIEEAEVVVPNVFTPNGDGINDVLEIQINGSTEQFINDFYMSSSLVIFDRWGRQMYESNNYQNDWKGEGCPDGVYFYYLKCNGRFKDDKFAGSVTILTVGE